MLRTYSRFPNYNVGSIRSASLAGRKRVAEKPWVVQYRFAELLRPSNGFPVLRRGRNFLSARASVSAPFHLTWILPRDFVGKHSRANSSWEGCAGVSETFSGKQIAEPETLVEPVSSSWNVTDYRTRANREWINVAEDFTCLRQMRNRLLPYRIIWRFERVSFRGVSRIFFPIHVLRSLAKEQFDAHP